MINRDNLFDFIIGCLFCIIAIAIIFFIWTPSILIGKIIATLFICLVMTHLIERAIDG
jgi:multisubunit Na+/H+ antiporter MnhG subunit